MRYTFDNAIIATKKKNRVVWTAEMHRRFLKAVDVLGPNSSPAKILKVMNVNGLTRLHVSSHLQKYRLTKSEEEETPSDEAPKFPPSIDVGMNTPHTFKLMKVEGTYCNVLLYSHNVSSLISTNCGNISSSFLPLSGFCSSV